MKNDLFSKIPIVTGIDCAIIMPPEFEPAFSHPNRPDHGLAYAISGTVEYIFDDGERFVCTPHNLIYLPRRRGYHIKKHERGYTACVNFKLSEDTEVYSPFMLEIRDRNRVEQLYSEARTAHSRGIPESELACYSALYGIMSIVESERSPEYISPVQSEKLDLVMNYIENGIADTSLTVENLAALAGITPVWLRRLFLAKYGMQPSKYIKARRIGAAKELLVSTDLPNNDIALHTGFSDPAYFCREFRRIVGMTPGRYRGEYRM